MTLYPPPTRKELEAMGAHFARGISVRRIPAGARTLSGQKLTARPHKYRAKPARVDGVFFASKKEAKRWGELTLALAAGTIESLARQVSFPLVVNGVKVATWVADHVYDEIEYGEGGKKIRHTVVEDVKGHRTPLYLLKRRLFEALYGWKVREI